MQRPLLIKLLSIVAVAMLLLIPLSMIDGKVDERSRYRHQAIESISQSWTGEQQLAGPFLVVPYSLEWYSDSWDDKKQQKVRKRHREQRYQHVLLESLGIEAEVVTDTRQRGIYRVPVYTAQLQIQGLLRQQTIQQTYKKIRRHDNLKHIEQAYLALTVSDPRGINRAPSLQWNQQSLAFAPGSWLSSNSNGIHALLPADLESTTADISLSFSLALRGMESLVLAPVAQNAEVTMQSSWPHPQFHGAFLPVERTIDDTGFSGRWQVSSFANNIEKNARTCVKASCKKLFESSFGVRFIDPVDVYVQSERSLKYGILFVGLSFIVFFVFEVLKKLPIHPVQYTLVGFALAVFYLLLISLAEHIPFALAYAIAAVCCVGLLLFYVSFVLRGLRLALGFAAGMMLLYGTLYVIVQAEDFAMLMGSLLTFSVLAAVMYVTRGIDWYQVGDAMSVKEVVQTENLDVEITAEADVGIDK